MASQEDDAVMLYNPFEGKADSRQLNETVADFLQRLPPVMTLASKVGPWIWIANPYSETVNTPGNVHSFIETGTKFLEQFKTARRNVEHQDKRKAEAAKSAELSILTQKLKVAILNAARDNNVLSGKWMLFVEPKWLSTVWHTVAELVATNQLGTAAKVATARLGEDVNIGTRLICVYTKDFNDTEELTRILRVMIKNGLVDAVNKPGIFYKTDAFTWLNIKLNNEYNLQPSLYNSRCLMTT